MAIKKIDLNKFELCNSEEDILEGQSGLAITPLRLADGTQPRTLYFKKGVPKQVKIRDVENTVWYKDAHISSEGEDHEYAKRVDWWFDNAMKDQDYKDIINGTFDRNGFIVRESWEKARNWLKKKTPSARKTHIHRFVWNWMTDGMRMQLERLEKKRTGQWR